MQAFGHHCLSSCQLAYIFFFRFGSEEEYEDLVRFVSQGKHMKNSKIFGSDNIFNIWHAGDDNDEEGVFLNWYTNQPMLYLPWRDNRPYSASTTYQYIASRIKMKTGNDTKSEVEEAKIYDYPDDALPVPVCTTPSRSLIFRIRGLCSDFSFDRDYVYTIDEQGQEVFRGKKDSVISYNTTDKLWYIFKPSDNSSFITSTALWNSFMIGR